MKHNTIYAFIFIFVLLFSIEAEAVVRECSYKIYVASDKEGISSTILPNGSLISKGRYKGKSSGKASARYNATRAAKRCLDTAFSNNKITKYCKPRDWVSTSDFFVSKYNIPKLKTAAFNTACNTARNLGIKKENLEGIMIYALNVKEIDAKSECNIVDDKINLGSR